MYPAVSCKIGFSKHSKRMLLYYVLSYSFFIDSSFSTKESVFKTQSNFCELFLGSSFRYREG